MDSTTSLTKLCFICLFLVKASLSTSSLPNIIFILTDDQGYADVGYHGGPIPTPNIDRLANGGLKLENYYVHPMCTPSRAALMTGRYAANVQMSDFVAPTGGIQGLNESITTLPQALKQFGYHNHMIGKWHLGHSKKKYLPINKGFDSFLGVMGLGINHVTKQVNNGVYDFMEDDHVFWDNTTHATELFGQRAIKIIEKQGMERSRRPMFLYLAFTAPHDPLIAMDEDLEACSHIQHYIRRGFCGMVHGVDRQIGKVISTLEKHNLMDNTIIVFSSDNGGSPWSGGFNYPFRGAKMTPLEGGVRVPAFIYGPKFLKSKSESTFNGLFHIADWYPTLIGFIKSSVGKDISPEITQQLDGIDQHMALVGDKKAYPRDRLLIHHAPIHQSHAYRRGPWKLIIGQHGLPFAEVHLYNEPERWLVPNGNMGDTFLDMAVWTLDTIFGLENSLTSFRALLMGVSNRFHPWWDEGSDMVKVRNMSGFQTIFHDEKWQNLTKWASYFEPPSNPDSKYPLLALYNLEKDPQEKKNLASKKKELVTQLIQEANKLLDKNGLPLFVGDLSDKMAPRVEGLQVYSRESSTQSQVVPAIPWLEDDEDVFKFPDDRIAIFLKSNDPNTIAFHVGVIFAVWAATPLIFIYSLLLIC